MNHREVYFLHQKTQKNMLCCAGVQGTLRSISAIDILQCCIITAAAVATTNIQMRGLDFPRQLLCVRHLSKSRRRRRLRRRLRNRSRCHHSLSHRDGSRRCMNCSQVNVDIGIQAPPPPPSSLLYQTRRYDSSHGANGRCRRLL